MENLVRKLQLDYTELIFTVGESHCWSPHDKQIFYESHDDAGLLHELGHARLQHQIYNSDLELLQKEVEAWEEARRLAVTYHIELDEEHIQDCLDTYRDWLHKRSTCPTCALTGLQQTKHQYRCVNCGQSWRVTTARFCRPYRRLNQDIKKSRDQGSQLSSSKSHLN